MEMVLEILFILVIWIMSKWNEWKFDNYMPPTGQRIDGNLQSLDRVKNHLSNEQVMQNTINGKYNVKDFMK